MGAHGPESKKRSGASSKSRPLEPLVFFLDRSLGKEKVSAALRMKGVQVEIHDDHFPSDAKDEAWLREVGSRGWIVLTKDKRIRHRGPELAAFRRARVRAFVLTSGNLRGEEMAVAFVKALPRMTRFATRSLGPFVGAVTKDGSVSFLSGGRVRARGK